MTLFHHSRPYELELSVTDENGIKGTVIAYIDDGEMTDYDYKSDDGFDPTFTQVERAFEIHSQKRTTWEG